MGNIIAAAIIILILILSIAKLVREKKKGVKCIGCIHGKECSRKCSNDIKKYN